MPNIPPPLPGTVQSAAPGLQGFDLSSPVSATLAKQFRASGFSFCCRYLPREAALVANNLTNAEAAGIVNSGLALVAVQHVALPGWNPTAALGTAYGTFGAIYAQQVVGLPAGMNIWCDLEGVAPHTPAADVIAYCEAWYNAVSAAGYVPGIYVGFDAGLTSQQLYENISFRHYWQAYNGPAVATRGFQMLQTASKKVNGIDIDPDTTQNDTLGGSLFWLSL